MNAFLAPFLSVACRKKLQRGQKKTVKIYTSVKTFFHSTQKEMFLKNIHVIKENEEGCSQAICHYLCFEMC